MSSPRIDGGGARFRYHAGACAPSYIHKKCEYFVAMPDDPELRARQGRWMSARPGKLAVRTVNSELDEDGAAAVAR